MHDLAKPSAPEREKKVARRKPRGWIYVVGAIVVLIGVIAALKTLGAAILISLVVVFSLVAVLFGLIAANRFRSGRTTAGAVFAVLCLFLVIVDVKLLQFFKMSSSPMVMPPTTVTSAIAKEEDWAPRVFAVGSVSAVQGAVLSTDLAGTVAEVKFESGAIAKKGDVLVKLAAPAEDADLELARNDLERTRDLAARKVISKAELDAAESKFKQKEGLVAKKEVRAPFDGQLGIRQVNVGQMINAGQQVIALTALNPVYVDFALPQQEMSKLSPGLEVALRSDAIPDREFKGKLTAINPMVDSVTRNVGLQATLENPDHALRPGMFAKVEVILPEKQKTLVVPGSAISYAPFGDSVFVIEKKKDPKTGKESQLIRQQFVRVGEARGDLVSIVDGLKANETIVSTGVFKLRNGMPVTINNELAPKPQLNPKPVDS